jgi:Domain of unknown function (DUF5916)/Carbohydrate family 9 binding domain-like
MFFNISITYKHLTWVFVGIACLFSSVLLAQKTIKADRIQRAIKIDAHFEELDWQTAQLAKDFVQNEPNPGKPAAQATEVRILYDDQAVYIAATMHDTHGDSIMHQLTKRDVEDGNTDRFAAVFDAYADGLNGLVFLVTAAGVQVDKKITINGDDTSWDAVWESATRRDQNGWYAEFKIPYSALRFPQKAIQSWKINFGRHIRRYRETDFWNEVKPENPNFLAQSGNLLGIENIKAPLRLSATPFFSTYFRRESNNWSRSITGGMDVKYGINDAFTLDMTLVPDFGQVVSDNKVLNLSPFEVQFDENRPFFTEGVELFNKGENIFYSRRVGGRLINASRAKADEGETTTSNPETAQLYNATKVSGRTNGGLGIGIFNATAAETFATIRNDKTGLERKVMTNPLTNYNVLVLDQNLPHSSYLTLLNTTVMRNGDDYDANTTSVLYDIRNKKNDYSVNGRGVLSQKYYLDSASLGYNYRINAGKIAGKWRWTLGTNVESRYLDLNDLGFLSAPNEQNFYVDWSYNQYNPVGAFNKYSVSGYVYQDRLHEPNRWAENGIGFNMFFLTKKIFAFGFNGDFVPWGTDDYFEPRNNYRSFYHIAANGQIGGFISTDWRKTVALDVNVTNHFFDQRGRNTVDWAVTPRLRVSDQLFILCAFTGNHKQNNEGFVGKDDASEGYTTLDRNAILIGTRKVNTITVTPTISYIFNPRMSFTFRARHYWSQVEYARFGVLQADGSLATTAYNGLDAQSKTSLHNNNYNAFSIDAVYLWRFAPGSDLTIAWKNNIEQENDDISQTYLRNLNGLFNFPQSNSFSLKILYFLDYLTLRRRKSA